MRCSSSCSWAAAWPAADAGLLGVGLTMGPTTPTPLGQRALLELYARGPASQDRLATLLWPRGAGWRVERRQGAVARAMRVLELAGLAEHVARAWQVTPAGEHVAVKLQAAARRRLERLARRAAP